MLPGWDLRGYAANDLSIFRLTWSYLSVTQNRAFLDERIVDQTVLQRLQTLATDWKKLLLKPSDELADYGEAPNLLECVPTYIHKVPSFNAANVWMMRELANILEDKGDPVEAQSLRDQANTMVGAVMALYEPGKGVWASLHIEPELRCGIAMTSQPLADLWHQTSRQMCARRWWDLCKENS